MPLGKALKEQHFLFEKNHVNLNHGSYGSYPRSVRDALHYWRDVAEERPDQFQRYTFPAKMNEIRHRLAQLLNADIDGTVLVPNATMGLNAILRNLKFNVGDEILYFTGIYPAIRNTVDYLTETTAVKGIEISYDPSKDTHEDAISRFQHAIREHCGHVKVAIFDTVTSMPGQRMPFERLTELCRQSSVLSVIDGAHGIGMVELNLKELDPDFFVTNNHKWLLAPRASAVLYVPPRNQHLMRSSLPTSHGFLPLPESGNKAADRPSNASPSRNSFVSQFQVAGTTDTAAVLCIPAVLEFRNQVCGGEKAIREYCVELARLGELRVVEMLGTNALPVPSEQRVAFANVRLPVLVRDDEIAPAGSIPADDVPAVIDFMYEKLTEDYHTFFNICYFANALWARLSAAVYLGLEDFEYGGIVLQRLCQRVVAKEYLKTPV